MPYRASAASALRWTEEGFHCLQMQVKCPGLLAKSKSKVKRGKKKE
jgi:hypothetical protein